MYTAAELLSRKQMLLESIQNQPNPEVRDEIERRLDGVNEELNRLEAEEIETVAVPS